MAGMSRKEIARIIEHVEPQGVRTTRTKSGILLRFPDDGTAMIHFTSSDYRQRTKVRADLKRHGISFPGDDAGPLAAFITDGGPVLKSTRQRVERALATWDQRYITGSQLRRLVIRLETGADTDGLTGEALKGLTNATAQKALYQLGWIPTGSGTGRKWLRPVELDPEPEWLAPTEAEDEPREIVQLHPDAAEAAPQEAAPAPEAEVKQAGGREFIDTADSWCADLSGFDEALTVAQLRQMMAAVGLSVELRVWREQ